MKQMQNLEELRNTLVELRDTQEDYIADGRSLNFKSDDKHSIITMRTINGFRDYPLLELAHDEMASRLHIPQSYYKYMQKEYPELLDLNVNGWLNRNAKNVLVRIQNGNVRAILSDKYRCLDNLELLDMAIPYMEGKYDDYHLESCGVTDSRMYIKYTSDRFTGDIRPGDTVKTGLVISNSEVGWGAVRVLPLIYRLVCTNGMIASQALGGARKNHVGTRIPCGVGEIRVVDAKILSEKQDEFLTAVKDGLEIVSNHACFSKIFEQMQKSSEVEFDKDWDTAELVKYVGSLFGMTRTEQELVKGQYNLAHDRTAYGLLNAITRASQDVIDYERATELERMGSMMLNATNVRLIRTHMMKASA